MRQTMKNILHLGRYFHRSFLFYEDITCTGRKEISFDVNILGLQLS